MESDRLRELQLLELEAIKEISKVCEVNNLEYFIIGGTLLGAVRHKGFIPWDDDIDIAMPRDSYNKLIELSRNNDILDKFKVENYKINNRMDCYFSRVFVKEKIRMKFGFEANSPLGLVMIDILPLDGVPNNKILRRLYYFRVLFYRTLAGVSNVGNKGIGKNRSKVDKLILTLGKKLRIYKILNKNKIFDKLDKIYSSNFWRDCEFSGTLTGAYNLKEIVPTHFWGNGKDYYFEDSYFKGPELYHEYLTHMYGEYNILPSVEERKSHF